MARAIVLDERRELAKRLRKGWVEAHPAVQEARQNYNAAEYAVRNPAWTDDALAYVDVQEEAKSHLDDARHALHQAIHEAEGEFDEKNGLDAIDD